ncbi:DNA polymerase Y family protein [Halomarina oriensis]|uniref:DNA polymerase IV n=1 Tax=Halomarina oriensis TaxID=671145 RepID=A0A6B0GJI1_9EURY|nr:DNA polymerase IV [Halomarina oriensis]MWG34011.1 DNA polymerase IV [Halomarina oriensis]
MPDVEATAGPTDDERVVLHVDMDCFYAACERRREPALDGEPVVVGMGYEGGETHGAVATASYEAREHGVESAQPISQALDALPRIDEGDGREDERRGETRDCGEGGPAGYYRPVDMAYYESVSGEVKSILNEVAETVREVSIDEAYLDVTDRVGWHSVAVFARSLKTRIDEEVGVPASIGVAPNMSTAKIASDHDKPDGLVVVEPDEVRSFLAPLPVDDLHGVGPVTARELRSMGIETANDLAAADQGALVDRFGSRGRAFHQRARGVDPRVVEPVGRPKSLSSESAFTGATDDPERIEERLTSLAAEVADRAEERGALYKTIGIKVVRPPFDVNTRARSLSGPVADAELVRSVATELVTEFDGQRVRKLGVRVSNLSFAEGTQSGLGRWEGHESDVESTGRSAARDERSPSADRPDPPDGVTTPTLTEWGDADGSNGEADATRTTAPPTETDGGDSTTALPPGQTTVFDFV